MITLQGSLVSLYRSFQFSSLSLLEKNWRNYPIVKYHMDIARGYKFENFKELQQSL